MNSPVSALIGVLAITFGLILVYAGIKNKRVFGEGGIVQSAIARGNLVDLKDVPPMWK